MTKQLNKKGTSLVELIAVIVIMGIIAGIAIPTTIAVINRQKKNAAVKSMESLVSTCKNLILEAQASATGTAVYLSATYTATSGTPASDSFALKNNNASGAAITGFSAADLNVDGLKFAGTITCTFTIASATWSWAIDGDCTSNGVEVAMASDGTVTPA